MLYGTRSKVWEHANTKKSKVNQFDLGNYKPWMYIVQRLVKVNLADRDNWRLMLLSFNHFTLCLNKKICSKNYINNKFVYTFIFLHFNCELGSIFTREKLFFFLYLIRVGCFEKWKVENGVSYHWLDTKISWETSYNHCRILTLLRNQLNQTYDISFIILCY